MYPLLHHITMESSLFEPGCAVIASVWSLKCSSVLWSCLSYSRGRGHINLRLLCSLGKIQGWCPPWAHAIPLWQGAEGDKIPHHHAQFGGGCSCHPVWIVVVAERPRLCFCGAAGRSFASHGPSLFWEPDRGVRWCSAIPPRGCLWFLRPRMRYEVTVVADDFGVNRFRDLGIATAFQYGLANFVTFLVNGENPDRSVRLARAAGLLDCLGLHVNLTEGLPVSAPHVIPSLVGADGRFKGKTGFFEAIQRGHVDTSDVLREVEAQLLRFEHLTGHKPTYADGHHHVHVFEPVVGCCAAAFAHAGVTATRIPHDRMFLRHLTQSDRAAAAAAPDDVWVGTPFYRRVCHAAAQAEPQYSAVGVRSAHIFVGLGLMGRGTSVSRMRNLVCSGFTSLQPPSALDRFCGATKVLAPTEAVMRVHIMTHPGLIPRPKEVPSGGEEFWYDAFALSPDREHELRVLCSKDLLRCVRAEPQVQCAGMGVGLDTAEDPRAQIQCTPRAYCPSTESVWTRDGPLTGGAPH